MSGTPSLMGYFLTSCAVVGLLVVWIAAFVLHMIGEIGKACEAASVWLADWADSVEERI